MKAYIMGNYTEKAFQGFLKDPKSDRKAVVEQLTKAMGGTMHSMDIVRGSYDFVVVNELATFEDFAAVKLVVEASGAVKNLTMLEAIDFNKATTKASEVANDTLYGLGAGVWTRNGNIAYRMGRAIQAGIVWTNCYHAYPAHSPFGGYKQSGVGRETHKMMLDHYRQNKNLHVSYAEKKLGFF